MLFDMENGKMGLLSDETLRQLKEDLYKRLKDLDGVGDFLSDRTSEAGPEKTIAKSPEVERDKNLKNLRKKISTYDERLIKLRDGDLNTEELKDLEKALKKENSKTSSIINTYLNSSNNHIKEKSKRSKKSSRHHKHSKVKKETVIDSSAHVVLQPKTSDPHISFERPKTPPFHDPITTSPINDLLKHPPKYSPVPSLSKIDPLRKASSERLENLLGMRVSHLGLDPAKKDLMDYSCVRVSKLDAMLDYLHKGDRSFSSGFSSDTGSGISRGFDSGFGSGFGSGSDSGFGSGFGSCSDSGFGSEFGSSRAGIGRLGFSNNSNYLTDIITSCTGSPFPLEHLEDTFAPNQDYPFNVHPLDFNNSSNCDYFALKSNMAYFDCKARKINDAKYVKDLKVEKVQNRCCCNEERCMHGMAGAGECPEEKKNECPCGGGNGGNGGGGGCGCGGGNGGGGGGCGGGNSCCPQCCSGKTNEIIFCNCCGYLFPKPPCCPPAPKFHPCLSSMMGRG